MLKEALIIYWTHSGNTEKVALNIKKGLEKERLNVSLVKVNDAEDIDFFNFDLVCIGSPSYNWHPPKPVDDFLKRKFNYYKKRGHVKVNAPKIPGKNTLIFCTYSGPHTGIKEAIPAGKYMGQFFEHIGFNIVDEWYVLSEFIGLEENNTLGRMGDIRGLPNKDALDRIIKRSENLAKRL